MTTMKTKIIAALLLAAALASCSKEGDCADCELIRAAYEKRMDDLCSSYGNGKNGMTWVTFSEEAARINSQKAAREDESGCSVSQDIDPPCHVGFGISK